MIHVLRRVNLIKSASRLRFNTTSQDALSYLTETKGFSPIVAAAMLKAMASSPSSTVSLRDLHAFGNSGIDAMHQAVQRELSSQAKNELKPMINIYVSAPHNGLNNTLVQAKHGSSFLDLSNDSDVVKDYLECACNGIAACSTCHIILDEAQMHLFDAADEAEVDMLDLAADLRPTSRLGCQLVLTEKHDGLKVTFPESSTNYH